MKIEINTKTLSSYGITPDQYVLLNLLYHKDFETIKSIFTKSQAINVLDSFNASSTMFLNFEYKIENIVLSKKEVERLLGIKGDNINFWEWYNCYPVKVGTRILRASGPTSQLALKHEKKYLSKVKTEEQHQKAIKAITVFVAKQKMSGKLEYLPNIETVLNNSLWEVWSVLVETKGTENGSWNSEII